MFYCHTPLVIRKHDGCFYFSKYYIFTQPPPSANLLGPVERELRSVEIDVRDKCDEKRGQGIVFRINQPIDQFHEYSPESMFRFTRRRDPTLFTHGGKLRRITDPSSSLLSSCSYVCIRILAISFYKIDYAITSSTYFNSKSCRYDTTMPRHVAIIATDNLATRVKSTLEIIYAISGSSISIIIEYT